MARLHELQARAKTLLTEQQEIRDRYTGADVMTQEDANRWDALMTEHDSVVDEIAREQRATDLERIKTTPVGALTVPAATSEAEKASKFTVEETMKAYANYLVRGLGGIRPDDLEKIRAYQADNDQEGGYLVAPQEMVAGLLRELENMVFIRGVARKFTVVKAESLGVVTLDSGADDPTWTSELATGEEENGLRLGKRALFPHPLAQRVKISRKLIRQATVDPAALLISEMTRQFGHVEENAFLTGDGHEKPLGIFTAHADGIPTSRDVITGSQTDYTADGLINALYTLKGPYRRNSRWILHRESLRQIRKLKYGDGTYIWSSGLERDGEPNILGRPYIESEFAPNTFTNGNYGAVLGDFSFYWIVDALDVQFQVLNELYAVTNQIGYIGRKETDAQPVMGEAFVRLKFATS
jgi:HK97 family phage major capsid protein